MSRGTIISDTSAQTRIEAWQNTTDAQLAQTFTNESSLLLVFELSGDPLTALLAQWKQTEEARFRMHAAVGEAGAFEVLLEVISGTPVTELQSNTLYVPALTSAEIRIPAPEPTTPPREIAASEAKTMSDEWKNIADDNIAATVSGSEGRLRYVTYEQEKTITLKTRLETISDPKLQGFLAVKTPDLQAKYEDDSDILITFICHVSYAAPQENQLFSFFNFGEFCPPYCQ
jgi:hypothetical protein